MTRIDGETQIEAHQGDSKVISITVELEDIEQLVWGSIEETDSTTTGLQVKSYKIDFLTKNPILADGWEITELGAFYKVTQQNSRGEDGTIADRMQFNVSINTEEPGTWIYQVRLDITYTYTDSTDGSSQTKTITQMLIPDGIIKVTGGDSENLGNLGDLNSEIKILIDAFDKGLTAVKDKTAAIKRRDSTTQIADENVVIDANVKIGLKTDGKGIIEVDNAAKTALYTMNHQNAAERSELANKAYVDANVQSILGAAPQELNSLGKIAVALEENSNHDRESEERIAVLEDKTAHITRVDENIVDFGGDVRYDGQTNSHQYKMAGQDGYSDFANTEYVDGLVGVLSSLAVDEAAKLKEVTYAELKALRDNSQLKKGMKYRITDFVTTVGLKQRDCRSAGHPFDIIVTALDVNVLDENASAICHEGDTYFAESKLESWEIKYCLDNDIYRFYWADTTINGKGVIWYMKDQFNNECYYDFKNIQFKRWALVSVEDERYNQFLYSTSNRYYGAYEIGGEDYGEKVIWGEFGVYKWCYTFHNDYDDTDFSLKNVFSQETINYIEESYGDNSNNYAHDNKIGVNHIQWYHDFEDWYYGSAMALSYNVFYVDAYENIDEDDFGIGVCFSNVLKYSCHSNTFGNSCYYNTFGNSCHSNTFGNSCYYNTFGNSCYYNTFGNSCYYNTFGNICYYNTFGNSCYSNTFGNSCYYNTFGNNCYYNTFGNNCYYNTFGNSCRSNTFGNGCHYNKIFDRITNSPITQFAQYNIFENGVSYVTLTTSSAENSWLQNVTISQGVKGASNINPKVVSVARNLSYQTLVKATNSVTMEA